MKKIFLTLITCTILLGCSKNEENTNLVSVNKNKMKEDLIGSWKLIGYYSDEINPETGTNYFALNSETNDKIKLKSDNTIFSYFNNSIIGIYSVSQDSIITFYYNSNSNNPNTSYSNKITFLSNQFLELSSVDNTSVAVATERYEKEN